VIFNRLEMGAGVAVGQRGSRKICDAEAPNNCGAQPFFLKSWAFILSGFLSMLGFSVSSMGDRDRRGEPKRNQRSCLKLSNKKEERKKKTAIRLRLLFEGGRGGKGNTKFFLRWVG